MQEDQVETDFWADGGVRDQINDRVYAYIREHRDISIDINSRRGYQIYVDFSAWPRNYRNNLDDVAVEGRVKLVNKESEFFGDRELRFDYESDVLTNPTWLEVTLCANDMINKTGDNHHIYLEGIKEDTSGRFTLDDKSFIKLYTFVMGL